jgi:hypothetical protein
MPPFLFYLCIGQQEHVHPGGNLFDQLGSELD